MSGRQHSGGTHGQRTHFHAPRRGHRWALGLLGVIVVLAQALLVSPVAAAGRPPGGEVNNPDVRAADLASPAVVRIATLYTARLSLAVCGHHTTLPASGEGYTIGGLGSGAFVSANGVILTADHVVNIQPVDLVDGLLSDPPAARAVASAVNDAHCPGLPAITAQDVANGVLDALGIAYAPSFSQPRYLVWRATSYTGTLSATTHSGAGVLGGLLAAPSLPAKILVESPFAQNDLALLQVSLTDTPSIPLGNAQALAPEDSLTLLGFPGNADETSNGQTSNPNNLLTLSVNSLKVSALKQNDDGALLIETSGNVEHGDSGGPVLDSDGRLVGVVSYGGADLPSGTSFLRSSTSAQSLLSSASIDVTPGPFQRLWQQAFSDYTASYTGHWHTAARELDTLLTHYPTFQGAKPYQQYAQAAAHDEAVVQVGGMYLAPMQIGVAAGGLLVALLGLLFLALMLVWRKRGQRGAQVAGGAPVMGQGAAAYGWGAYGNQPLAPVGAYAPRPAQPWAATQATPPYPHHPSFPSAPSGYPTSGPSLPPQGPSPSGSSGSPQTWDQRRDPSAQGSLADIPSTGAPSAARPPWAAYEQGHARADGPEFDAR